MPPEKRRSSIPRPESLRPEASSSSSALPEAEVKGTPLVTSADRPAAQDSIGRPNQVPRPSAHHLSSEPGLKSRGSLKPSPAAVQPARLSQPSRPNTEDRHGDSSSGSGVVVTPMRIISVTASGPELPSKAPQNADQATAQARSAADLEETSGAPFPETNPAPADLRHAAAPSTDIAAPSAKQSSVPNAPTPLLPSVESVSSAAPLPQPAPGAEVPATSLAGAPMDPAAQGASSLASNVSDDSLEALGDDDLSVITSDPPPSAAEVQKRLPPKPPPRTSFSEELPAVNEDGSTKKVPWYEEIFSADFLRAELIPSESQLRPEVDFIESSLDLQQGSVLLDLACGSGRHAVALAERGYNVVGYDLGLHQLALASERAQSREQKVSFLQGDMREMAFENTFDGVLFWGASFGYFEEEKNLAVLRNVYKALKPGGNLLLDVPNRDFVVAQQPAQNWFEGDAAVCMDDMHVNFITSRLSVKRTLMMEDGRNKECTSSMRLYGLHELGRMLHDIGFRVAQVSGAVTTPQIFLGVESPRIVMLMSKP